MATGGSSPCLDSNPDPSSGDAGVTGEVPGPTTKRGRYYVPVNFSDDPTIRVGDNAVNKMTSNRVGYNTIDNNYDPNHLFGYDTTNMMVQPFSSIRTPIE